MTRSIQTTAPVALSNPAAHPLGICIGITPRGEVSWSGTAAELIAEGVAPADFTWLKVMRTLDWKSGPFRVWALCHRPEWISGKVWKALPVANRDYGTIYVRDAALGRDGFAAAREFEALDAVRRFQFSKSAEGAALWNRYYLTTQDRRYQDFMRRLGARPIRGRMPSMALAAATPTEKEHSEWDNVREEEWSGPVLAELSPSVCNDYEERGVFPMFRTRQAHGCQDFQVSIALARAMIADAEKHGGRTLNALRRRLLVALTGLTGTAALKGPALPCSRQALRMVSLGPTKGTEEG